MGKQKAPTPPSPTATAAAQTGQNVATSIANNVGGWADQTTPYGKLTRTQTGSYTMKDPNSGKTYDIPTWAINQSLTPGGQRIQDATMATQENLAGVARDQSGRIGDLLGRPMDMSSVTARQAVPQLQKVGAPGQASGAIGDAGGITRSYGIADRGRVEDAIYSRLEPRLAQDRASVENRLRQQGITPGSSAWDREMNTSNQAATDARMQAVLAGGQEQSRMTGLFADRAGFQNAAQQQQFGQNVLGREMGNSAIQQNLQGQMATAGFNNASAMDAWRAQEAQRAASIGEAYQQRNQPINEISALLGGSQLQAPNFMNGPGLNMPTTDVAGITQSAYNQQLAAWQQNQAAQGSMLSGLGGLFGGIGAMKGLF